MPATASFGVCAAAAPDSRPSAAPEHEGEESPTTARHELQLLEDHRPWEMLDNMVLAIIDQTYAAVLEILRLPQPPPQEGDRHHVTLSVNQRVDSADPDSPEVRVEASAKHCCIYAINNGSHVGGTDIFGRDLAKHPSPGQRSTWPPRHRLTRASIRASLGSLCLARVDGGGHDDYWNVRPDVAGKGLLGVLDAIRSRLDAATRLESRLLEIGRARRRRDAKVRAIVSVSMALEDMRREVDLELIVCRERFRKRHRVRTISSRAEVDMDVDREDEEDVLSKRLKALHM